MKLLYYFTVLSQILMLNMASADCIQKYEAAMENFLTSEQYGQSVTSDLLTGALAGLFFGAAICELTGKPQSETEMRQWLVVTGGLGGLTALNAHCEARAEYQRPFERARDLLKQAKAGVGPILEDAVTEMVNFVHAQTHVQASPGWAIQAIRERTIALLVSGNSLGLFCSQESDDVIRSSKLEDVLQTEAQIMHSLQNGSLKQQLVEKGAI